MKKIYSENPRFRQIIDENEDIIKSEYFQKAWHCRHHLRTTVASHSLIVAYLCHTLCISGNRKYLVRAALLHDLGMIDNREKWKTTKETCYNHPCEAVKIAKEFTENPLILSTIENHMFPLSKSVPKHPCEYLFNLCDKLASITDTFVVLPPF